LIFKPLRQRTSPADTLPLYLAWRLSRELSATIRVATLREATKPLLEAHHKGSIDLIVDGGSENNNATVDGFISEGGISIHKLVALRDVHFSNSIVEAVNKVVKYRYLFPKNLPDGDALQTAALAAIVDYNDFRPHGTLNGLTPTEAYQGIEKETLLAHDKLKTAQRARIEHNGRNRCQKCRD
jgi:putative transposase